MALGENALSLGQRYHHAAAQLSRSFKPGSAGLEQVQQLFLAAYWFKSEAMFAEAWHSLGAAIHEAQELGSPVMPTRELEYSTQFPGLPSPFSHVALVARLSRNICTKIDLVDEFPTVEQVLAVQAEVDEWVASFPLAYHFTEPDRRWDLDHPYVVSQRLQLHTTALMSKLGPLKPFITRKSTGPTPEINQNFRNLGIDCCLKLIEASRMLFDSVFPICPRFHLLVCCIFDSAALLCSALLHDSPTSLAQRGDIFEALKVSFSMLEKLKPLTKIGSVCYTVIASLIATIRLSAAGHEPLTTTSLAKELAQQQQLTSHNLSDVNNDTIDGDPLAHEPHSTDLLTYQSLTESEKWQFWQDPNSQPPSLSDVIQMDLGELDQIWDWDERNLGFGNII
ncbi:uncharacterized protein HMPREF1541_07926 [Cyphellophora europaea CBS 101466]|uniref:Transcription factor domain-containing protein n=1 Tax=Cyphellophora europaea (strain CBS 101466) TaxID=1220924 RepID=W2RMJ4_CYPE1|nr:uncharacterized protein HMPREF1541_07926 [Cyphellophora europaea CBS 101466]ETN36939.1 hypothetical protein HMPREF1541_07926 [Cyphellophora europaea CBS 101466]